MNNMAFIKLKTTAGKSLTLAMQHIVGYRENDDGVMEVYTTTNDVFEVQEGLRAVNKRIEEAQAS